MTRARADALRLAPHAGVALEDGRLRATNDEPWLRFVDPSPFRTARFVELRYRAAFWDDPVRPVLRFHTRGGDIDRILPGPVAGIGLWRGAVPRHVHDVSISPAARPGRFDFRIEDLRRLSHLDMAKLVLARRPQKLWSIAIAALFGYRAEAENALDWAIGAEPPEAFEAWRALREAPQDMDGIDAPRSDWGRGPRFFISVDAARGDCGVTVRALREQAYPHFEAAIAGDVDPALFSGDARFSIAAPGAFDARGADFIACLDGGDAPTPQALAAIAEEAARNPSAQMFYADECIVTPDGLRPGFKPDWSPIFEAARPFVGRCIFARAAMLEGRDHNLRAAALATPRADIAHVRRWLMTRAEEASPKPVPFLPGDGPEPSVTVILLTKDRADLLAPCLDSLLRKTAHSDFNVVVVDNGTRDARAAKILDAAATDPRVKVLRRPEAFNFAAFNNEAAKDAGGEVLLFLNNDTEIVAPDWLAQMARAAMRADVGAVGARLLYPDGRIQHAGVGIGAGGDAGHFDALIAEDAPSWLGRNDSPHECSAVTAACMAVERRKFEAVGGFDAAHLPIEFNDVDLCLRLLEHGWPSLYLPGATLIHKESATRGTAAFRPLKVYARERDYFRARWRAVIRDDPYLHPALSLYARRAALG